MSFAIGSGSMTSVIAHWAAEHARSMEDELRTSMKQADERAQLLKELNDMKTAVARAAADPREFPRAYEMVRDFNARNPEYQHLFGPLETDLAYEVLHYATQAPDDNSRNILAGFMGQNGRWGMAFDSAIDDLRTQDRMGMLGIEDLVDKLKQAEMLGSNLIRALHDSAQSVIGNIG